MTISENAANDYLNKLDVIEGYLDEGNCDRAAEAVGGLREAVEQSSETSQDAKADLTELLDELGSRVESDCTEETTSSTTTTDDTDTDTTETDTDTTETETDTTETETSTTTTEDTTETTEETTQPEEPTEPVAPPGQGGTPPGQGGVPPGQGESGGVTPGFESGRTG